jgi:protein involved in polysaccharide export with SLBB domain
MTMKLSQLFKRLSVFSISALIVFAMQTAFAQQTGPTQQYGPTQQVDAAQQYGPTQITSQDFMKELQTLPPQTAAEIYQAIQRGDMQAAQQIYVSFKQQSGSTQIVSQDFMKEFQNLPPQTAAEIFQAIQRGDLQAAQQIYVSFKMKRMQEASALKSVSTGYLAIQPEKPSLFERTLSGEFPTDIFLLSGIKQFGYDLFLRTTSSFFPSGAVPVGPDYIIGPEDQFTMTLWGTTEGIYMFKVSKEGKITLPKVGVVDVAGVRFGDLETTLRRHLMRHYTNFNLSVAMGSLKTITIYVVGEVRNPGSYSLNSLTSVYGALFVAGGPTKKGTMRAIQVLRAGKIVKTLDLYDFLLRGDRSQDIRLQHDDTVFVPLIGPVAGVAGMVYRPAIYELTGGESLGNLIGLAGGVMPIGLGSRIQLQRYISNEKKNILDITLSGPTAESGKAELEGKVQNMDVITVFPLYDQVWETVSLSGNVRYPGKFQWRPDLRLKEIIIQGQLLPTVDLRRAEVIRLTDDYMDRKIIPIDLEALMKGDERQNALLKPNDHIKIYTTYREVEKIDVSGEVVRPGMYEVFKGERLSDLILRVGGFTPEAYPYGVILKRKDVKNMEQKNLQTFISKMQSQILQASAAGTATASSAEEAGVIKSELTVNQGLIENLKSIQGQFEGRVAINISEDINQWVGTKDDLLLQDGDSLFVPQRPQEVLVIGEVHSQGAQIFQPGMTVKDYIGQTGGLTKNAEKDEIFVVKANGFAVSGNSPSVGNMDKVELNAGDTVFVPQKVERYAAMRFIKDIIDIVFKAAVIIGVAVAIH